MSHSPKSRVLLVILDGWGLTPKMKGNAVALGQTPVFDRLMNRYLNTELIASGSAIDLPPGHMGNSEVGHQNIGAGRIVPQPSTTITRAIDSGSFFDRRRLLPKAMKAAKLRDGHAHAHGAATTVHLFGLLSDGLVHSHIDHAFALLELAAAHNVVCVVHVLLDGRDVPPKSAEKYITQLENVMNKLGTGRIGTLTGRVLYERDHKKWDHVEKLYRLLIHNEGHHVKTPLAAIERAYRQGVCIDEHIPPFVIVDDLGEPISKVRDGDLFINWNFRGDRATMLSHALVDNTFDHFARPTHPNLKYFCMSQYDDDIAAPVAYPPTRLFEVLSEVISRQGLSQFKAAETTKFFHLTFFFNCRRKRPFANETQKMIPSKKTEHYDTMPEMSAVEVADTIIDALSTRQFEFLAVNFANPDMVGHTGNLPAAIKAVEVVDQNLGRVMKSAQEHDYTMIVTADHGNADQMLDYTTGEPHTAHTANNVPFILILAKELQKRSQKPITFKNMPKRLLGNIAPTILDLMGLPKPAEMTCSSLLK